MLHCERVQLGASPKQSTDTLKYSLHEDHSNADRLQSYV